MHHIEFNLQGEKIPDNTIGGIYQELKKVGNRISIAFPCLKDVENLPEKEHRTFTINVDNRGARSWGLLTCASVIIIKVSQAGATYKGEKCFVYHAFGGVVSKSILITALNSLHISNFNDCFVIYAHTKNSGEYNKYMQIFDSMIHPDRLIEVFNVEAAFGVQSNGVIGF